MQERISQQLAAELSRQPYALLFATLSGAHLYGFASPDSDYDVRGVHVLPVSELIGLDIGPETREESEMRGAIEWDLVTHDLRKFISLLLGKNGYVLEQLYSPLALHTSPAHEELKLLAQGCITRHHYHHYLGFAESEWKHVVKEQPPRIKPVLYLFRVLLSGVHLMKTGEVEANLSRLNALYPVPYLPDLIAQKQTGGEHMKLAESDLERYRRDSTRLKEDLLAAAEASTLPDFPSARPALHDFLVRQRLAYLA